MQPLSPFPIFTLCSDLQKLIVPYLPAHTVRQLAFCKRLYPIVSAWLNTPGHPLHSLKLSGGHILHFFSLEGSRLRHCDFTYLSPSGLLWRLYKQAPYLTSVVLEGEYRRKIILGQWPYLKSLVFITGFERNEKTLSKILTAYPSLTLLDLSESVIPTSGYADMARTLTDLKTLRVAGNVFRSPTLFPIDSFTSLIELNPYRFHFRISLKLRDEESKGTQHIPIAKDFDEIVCCRGFLNFGECGLGSMIPSLTNLVVLNITDTSALDPFVQELSELTQLEQLSLDCAKLTDLSVPAIAQLTRLQTLEIPKAKFTDKGFSLLFQSLRKLTAINLKWSVFAGPGLVDGQKYLTALVSLNIKRIRCPKQPLLFFLKSLTNLQRLKWRYENLWPELYPSISSVTELVVGIDKIQHLSIEGAQIDLCSIYRMTNLTHLKLPMCDLNDSFIESLTTLTQLTLLNVGINFITDRGTAVMRQHFTNLTSLNLIGNHTTKASDKKLFKKLKLVDFHPSGVPIKQLPADEK